MSLVLTRIDNRLIHGQVLESWVPFVNADCIIVANDEIAGNPLKKMMMQASVPSRMKVEIGKVEEVVALLRNGPYQQSRVLLLFGTTADALKAYRCGLEFDQLNLGNLHAERGKAQLSCTVFLDPGDVDDLEFLDQHGVEISARCIPADSARPWRKLVPLAKGID